MIAHKMEFEIENYRLRATAEGKIERFWKEDKREKKPDRWKELKGRKVGGYLQIVLYLTSGKREVKVHRLVYLAYNPDWDIWDSGINNLIDHRDRIRTNNKIKNLQQVTAQQNNFNTSAKGYTFNKKSGKYHAQIGFDRKTIHLGDYDTPEEAREAYLAEKATLHIIR